MLHRLNTTHDWEHGANAPCALGQVVEIHPRTGTWMQGDRFGEIVKLGRKWAHVRFYASGRTLRCHPIILRLAAQTNTPDMRPAYASSWPSDTGL